MKRTLALASLFMASGLALYYLSQTRMFRAATPT